MHFIMATLAMVALINAVPIENNGVYNVHYANDKPSGSSDGGPNGNRIMLADRDLNGVPTNGWRPTKITANLQPTQVSKTEDLSPRLVDGDKPYLPDSENNNLAPRSLLPNFPHIEGWLGLSPRIKASLLQQQHLDFDQQPSIFLEADADPRAPKECKVHVSPDSPDAPTREGLVYSRLTCIAPHPGNEKEAMEYHAIVKYADKKYNCTWGSDEAPRVDLYTCLPVPKPKEKSHCELCQENPHKMSAPEVIEHFRIVDDLPLPLSLATVASRSKSPIHWRTGHTLARPTQLPATLLTSHKSVETDAGIGKRGMVKREELEPPAVVTVKLTLTSTITEVVYSTTTRTSVGTTTLPTSHSTTWTTVRVPVTKREEPEPVADVTVKLTLASTITEVIDETTTQTSVVTVTGPRSRSTVIETVSVSVTSYYERYTTVKVNPWDPVPSPVMSNHDVRQGNLDVHVDFNFRDYKCKFSEQEYYNILCKPAGLSGPVSVNYFHFSARDIEWQCTPRFYDYLCRKKGEWESEEAKNLVLGQESIKSYQGFVTREYNDNEESPNEVPHNEGPPGLRWSAGQEQHQPDDKPSHIGLPLPETEIQGGQYGPLLCRSHPIMTNTLFCKLKETPKEEVPAESVGPFHLDDKVYSCKADGDEYKCSASPSPIARRSPFMPYTPFPDTQPKTGVNPTSAQEQDQLAKGKNTKGAPLNLTDEELQDLHLGSPGPEHDQTTKRKNTERAPLDLTDEELQNFYLGSLGLEHKPQVIEDDSKPSNTDNGNGWPMDIHP